MKTTNQIIWPKNQKRNDRKAAPTFQSAWSVWRPFGSRESDRRPSPSTSSSADPASRRPATACAASPRRAPGDSSCCSPDWTRPRTIRAVGTPCQLVETLFWWSISTMIDWPLMWPLVEWPPFGLMIGRQMLADSRRSVVRLRSSGPNWRSKARVWRRCCLGSWSKALVHMPVHRSRWSSQLFGRCWWPVKTSLLVCKFEERRFEKVLIWMVWGDLVPDEFSKERSNLKVGCRCISKIDFPFNLMVAQVLEVQFLRLKSDLFTRVCFTRIVLINFKVANGHPEVHVDPFDEEMNEEMNETKKECKRNWEWSSCVRFLSLFKIIFCLRFFERFSNCSNSFQMQMFFGDVEMLAWCGGEAAREPVKEMEKRWIEPVVQWDVSRTRRVEGCRSFGSCGCQGVDGKGDAKTWKKRRQN